MTMDDKEFEQGHASYQAAQQAITDLNSTLVDALDQGWFTWKDLRKEEERLEKLSKRLRRRLKNFFHQEPR